MSEWLAPCRVAAAGPQAGRIVQVGARGALTHAALCGRVAAWCERFIAVGKKRLGLYEEDPFEFAAALWGGWHAGITWTLLPDIQPVTLQRLASEVDGFVGGVPEHYVPLRPPAFSVGAQFADLDEDDCAIQLLTSGSTGDPALIRKCLGQLAREVEGLQTRLGADLGQAWVYSSVSHQHIYGLLFRILWPLAVGRPIVDRRVMGKPERPGILVASPAYLKRLTVGGRFPMVAVFSSGGALTPQAAAQARAIFGVAPVEIYGSTETGGVAHRQGDEPWQPLPGVAWRMTDGCLDVQSPHLSPGTWWRTADRIKPAGDGFVLLGRADRIAKVEDKRVSLTAMEKRLRQHPWVVECRAVVLCGPRQMTAMAVVLSAIGQSALRDLGRRAISDALRAHLAEQFEAVTLPRRWHYGASLPQDTQGKITDGAVLTLFTAHLPGVRWLASRPADAEVELELRPDLAVFAGHFPEAPILPGIAQVDWAVQLGRQAFGMLTAVSKLEAIRFRRVIQPSHSAITTLRLHLHWDEATSRLAFEWHHADALTSHGRIIFTGDGRHA